MSVEGSCICNGTGQIGLEACPQCAGGPWVIRRDGTHVTGKAPAQCYNLDEHDRQEASLKSQQAVAEVRREAKRIHLEAVPPEAIEAACCLMDRYGFRVSVDALHLAHKARAKETNSERNQELYQMRLEAGLTFRELGARYRISAGRANQIFRQEERRAMNQLELKDA